MEIMLPWPPAGLSPNKRSHWAVKSKLAKSYRESCRSSVISTLFPVAPEFTEGKIHLFIDFFPPDKRHRDDDNCYAAFKSGRDGLADALGVNDRRFISHPCLRDTVVPGGSVRVRITQE